jgi:DUF1680 family protein
VVNHQRLALLQQSDYPVQGHVRLQVQAAPAHLYSIGLRIPGWCFRAKIVVNGQPQSLDLQPSSIAYIERQWQVGDTIEMQLEMPVQYLAAHPLVEECRGQIAVRRGPLIYCVESNDLSEKMRVQQVSIEAGSEKEWALMLGSDQIAGVPQLRGQLLVSSVDVPNTNEVRSLYHPYVAKQTKPVPAKLIPYYAWGNRGHSEMSVWIAVKP